MKTRQMIHAINVGIRSRLLICVLVIVAGYCFSISHDPLIRLISIIGVLVTSEIMIILWGTSFSKIISFPFSKKNTISWEEIPIFSEFKELAKCQNVKLNKKRPFGVKKDFDNAYANPLTGQIVVGDCLLNRLENGLLVSLIGHELTHIKRNHHLKLMLGTCFVPMIIATPLRFFGTSDAVYQVVFYAMFFIMFLLISWHNEYDADLGAAKIAGVDTTITLLRKIVPKQQWNKESETHPSIHARILKLNRHF